MAGTNLYWGHGEEALVALAQELGIPVFLNGLARGCVPADHELFFSRARSNGLKGADVALVIGVPMDFRLGFGQSFGEETELVVIDRAEPLREHPRAVAAELYGSIPGILDALRSEAARRSGHGRVGRARCAPPRTRSARPSAPSSTTTAPRCIPCACTATSARSSTATRSSSATAATSSPTPGASWTPTSPAAGWTRGRSGAWAAGPATRWRPRSPTPIARSCCWSATAPSASAAWSSTPSPGTASTWSAVMGNNGIWALEKHPMEFLYGYSVAAELRPGTRYDQVVAALGGHGELVERPGGSEAGARARLLGRRPGPRQRPHRPRRRLSPPVEPGVGPTSPTRPSPRACWPSSTPRTRSRPS